MNSEPASKQRDNGRSLVRRYRLPAIVAVGFGLGAAFFQFGPNLAADQPTATIEHSIELAGAVPEGRNPDVPDLPFPDNPDPTQCGIPAPWSGETQAWSSTAVQPVWSISNAPAMASV